MVVGVWWFLRAGRVGILCGMCPLFSSKGLGSLFFCLGCL